MLLSHPSLSPLFCSTPPNPLCCPRFWLDNELKKKAEGEKSFIWEGLIMVEQGFN